jgi:hypothetical protein
VFVEVVANRLDDLVTHRQVALHPRPAQVQVAVAQPDVLVGLLFRRDDERRCLRAVEDFEFCRGQLDLTGRQLRIVGARRTAVHGAAHAHDVFAAQGLRQREDGGLRRIERHLGEAGAIAHVDEDQAAVIAPAMNPSVEFDGAVDVGRGQRPAGKAFERVIHAGQP